MLYKKPHVALNSDVLCKISFHTNVNIRRSTLNAIYDNFKQKRFTQAEIYYKLWSFPNFSQGVVAAHVHYLRDIGFIKLVERGHGKKVYRFVVPREQWEFGGSVY